MPEGISTCAASLLNPGVCCVADCGQPARLAVLTMEPDVFDGVEHSTCFTCKMQLDFVVASKPFRLSPTWGGAS